MLAHAGLVAQVSQLLAVLVWPQHYQQAVPKHCCRRQAHATLLPLQVLQAAPPLCHPLQQLLLCCALLV
jgi:hypothetical protein